MKKIYVNIVKFGSKFFEFICDKTYITYRKSLLIIIYRKSLLVIESITNKL